MPTAFVISIHLAVGGPSVEGRKGAPGNSQLAATVPLNPLSIHPAVLALCQSQWGVGRGEWDVRGCGLEGDGRTGPFPGSGPSFPHAPVRAAGCRGREGARGRVGRQPRGGHGSEAADGRRASAAVGPLKGKPSFSR